MNLDFVITGVMKCGTTSLGEQLREHENIAIPKGEVGFFNSEKKYNKGYEWYESYVDQYATANTKVRGEKTPYSYDKSLTRHIWEYNPEIKLIFILRNPVDRAWSNYTHDLWNLDEWRKFEKCLREEPKRPLLYQYISKGEYIEQIRNYLQYFDRDQMHFIIFEDFIRNRERVLKQLFEFLNVSKDNYDYEHVAHSKKSYHPRFNPFFLHLAKETLGNDNKLWNFLWRLHFENAPSKKMNKATRKKLLKYYAPYNKELELFLGRQLEIWRN